MQQQLILSNVINLKESKEGVHGGLGEKEERGNDVIILSYQI